MLDLRIVVAMIVLRREDESTGYSLEALTEMFRAAPTSLHVYGEHARLEMEAV